MSALVIDTSSWINYFGTGRRADVIEDALNEGRVYLPPIVAAEMTSAVLRRRELLELQSFMLDLPLCHTPLEHWFRVGALRTKLLRVGETISTPDAHVAQCAIDLAGELLSEDRVFARIAGGVRLRLLLI
ncbi:MAG: PIN domain-containing protein [Myxococcota bacterium]